MEAEKLMKQEIKSTSPERVTLSAPRGFNRTLDELARERCVSRSDIVRQALLAEFERAGKQFVPEPLQVAA